MPDADDYAVSARESIFHYTQDAVGQRFVEVHNRIQQTVRSLADDDALAADPESWAQEIAAEFAVIPPTVDTAGHEFKQERRVDIDCTNWPGISYSTTEYGHVMRPGHRFRVTVLGEGDLRLLKTRLHRGGTGHKVDVQTGGLPVCMSGRRPGPPRRCKRTLTSSSRTSTLAWASSPSG